MLVGIVESPSRITDFLLQSLLDTFVSRFQIIASSQIVVVKFLALLSHCDADWTGISPETPKLCLAVGYLMPTPKTRLCVQVDQEANKAGGLILKSVG